MQSQDFLIYRKFSNFAAPNFSGLIFYKRSVVSSEVEKTFIMARKKQDIIFENVTIEAVAAEGKALARIDGTVLFVQFAVPGDVVDV